MSTKIYNGHILKDIEIHQFFKELQNHRDSFNLVLLEDFLKDYINIYYKLIDEQTLNGFINTSFSYDLDLSKCFYKDEVETDLSTVMEHIFKEYFSKSKITHTSYFDDLRFNLCLFPLEKNKTLLLPFGNEKVFKTILEKIKNVEFYGYWNNTDKDEYCTEEEWEERKLDWNNALPGIGIPNENSLIYELSEDIYSLYKIWSIKNLKDYDLSLKKRINNNLKILNEKKYSLLFLENNKDIIEKSKKEEIGVYEYYNIREEYIKNLPKELKEKINLDNTDLIEHKINKEINFSSKNFYDFKLIRKINDK